MTVINIGAVPLLCFEFAAAHFKGNKFADKYDCAIARGLKANDLCDYVRVTVYDANVDCARYDIYWQEGPYPWQKHYGFTYKDFRRLRSLYCNWWNFWRRPRVLVTLELDE